VHKKSLRCKCGGDVFVKFSSVQGSFVESKNGVFFEKNGKEKTKFICKKCGMDFYSSSVIQLIEKAQSSPEKTAKEIITEIKKLKTLSGISGEKGEKKYLSIFS